MHFNKRRLAQIFSIGIGALCPAAFFLRRRIEALAHWEYFPTCIFYRVTGYLCPACGNTRAVLALLHGHVLRSIGYNPMIVTLCAALLCLYGELICFALGKPRHILPRSNLLLFLTIGLVLEYDILRNLIPAITLCL